LASRTANSVIVLGIESSCDETAAALVRGPGERGVELLASTLASQDDLHAHFGGIVPEVASRRHVEMIVPVVREAMDRAALDWDDIDAIAVTTAPGLIGSLVVGVSAGKAFALARGLPIVGVHHLEGHIYGAAIGQPLPLPAVVLIASGGHSHLVLMREHGRYEVLGRTRDDAPGEAFDKGARLLGLPYPGGPALAALADSYAGKIQPMPRARIAGSLDFSFSGVKTALSRQLHGGDIDDTEEHDRARLAAAYQESIVLALAGRSIEAAEEVGCYTILVVGGVAANRRLREVFEERALPLGIDVRFPDPRLCTDNGAMVAAAGAYKLALSGAESAEALDCSAHADLESWSRAARDRPAGDRSRNT
jgi:N6-L-threonylcarbamoyladenine synthase